MSFVDYNLQELLARVTDLFDGNTQIRVDRNNPVKIWVERRD